MSCSGTLTYHSIQALTKQEDAIERRMRVRESGSDRGPSTLDTCGGLSKSPVSSAKDLDEAFPLHSNRNGYHYCIAIRHQHSSYSLPLSADSMRRGAAQRRRDRLSSSLHVGNHCLLRHKGSIGTESGHIKAAACRHPWHTAYPPRLIHLESVSPPHFI